MTSTQLQRSARALAPAGSREQSASHQSTHRQSALEPSTCDDATGFLAAVRRNRTRILIAALNGLVAFLFGLALETAFMRAGAGRFAAYVISNVFSTQLSFLLARYVTWRDRRVRFFSTLARYNAQQLSTTILSIIMFAGLDSLGVFYVAANFTVTVTVAPLSFLIAHNWSISERPWVPGSR